MSLDFATVLLCCSFAFACVFSFFFNDTPTSEIYTLSLHDALPIYLLCRDRRREGVALAQPRRELDRHLGRAPGALDRKSTRLNSSHLGISYAVFCLKKKKKKIERRSTAYPAHNPLLQQRPAHHTQR